MNCLELEEALEERGVKPHRYYIVGVTRRSLSGNGELVLDHDGTRWMTYGYDRGDEVDRRYFDTEEEACDYLFGEMTKPPRPKGPPLTPEQEERARRLQAEQEAWLREQWRARKTGLTRDQ